MRRHLIVRHTTEYHYAEPVSFGRHRMMFRPRDSHRDCARRKGEKVYDVPSRQVVERPEPG